MKLKGERLARDLERLATFGRDPDGGWTRPALSPADAQARAYVREEMLAMGLAVVHDEVGNLIGRRRGARDDAPVVTGSHLDTVPRGGRFDGPLGVAGALEAVRALDEAGVTTGRPIEVVAFTGEEGSRFPRGTIGSAAMSGDVPVAEIFALEDRDGVRFLDALATYADAGAPRPARRPPGSVHAFVELHIEQGGVLEARRIAVGAVTAIQGLVQHVARVRGDANHAGATPMHLRRDALAGAAEMVLAVERVAEEVGAVATVGRLEVEPGGYNIIPGAATLSIDLRAPDAGTLDELDRQIRAELIAAAERRALHLELTRRQRVEPAACAELVISAVERAAAEAGASVMRLPSGAIHDALHMGALCPTGMIFVPSVGGKSHCPEEESGLPEMLRGCEVLARTLAILAV
ncbi:MAG TPA: Zn-dependent hydrolase [Haliangiales bacterium]|nr:Zn-dependent hydrolase [Haliangiales bacterium]